MELSVWNHHLLIWTRKVWLPSQRKYSSYIFHIYNEQACQKNRQEKNPEHKGLGKKGNSQFDSYQKHKWP